MSEKKETIMTPKFRVSFPEIFVPKAGPQGGQEFYSVQMLFPKDQDLSPMKALCAKTAESFFGPTWKTLGLRMPFNDGDTKQWESHQGHIYVNAKTKFQVPLVDQKKQEILDQSEFYPGCYARAIVNAYAYNTAGNKGVAFGLMAVQKLAEGEKLGGGAASVLFGVVDTPEVQNAGPAASDDYDF